MEIQHSAGIQDFVFQVGSEEKVNWMWQTMVPVTFTSHQRGLEVFMSVLLEVGTTSSFYSDQTVRLSCFLPTSLPIQV